VRPRTAVLVLYGVSYCYLTTGGPGPEVDHQLTRQ
jgi:hypothetical protein